jgi:predicted permease
MDNQHSPSVVVIDDRFAELYFPGRNPIGRRVNFDIVNMTPEIVGVVGHIKQYGLDEDASTPTLAQCYLPVSQFPDRFAPLVASNLGIVVRTQGSPSAETGAIRQALSRINSQSVMYGTQTMDAILSDSLASRRFSIILMGLFAALALLMASVGIYAVIAYVTSQRTHEFGIRMALGAEKRDVLGMVVGQGLKLALMGVAIGIAGALALTRFLSSLLFGVKPTDPLTFIGVSLILIAVALAACYIPARRAAKVDPMVALRYE